MDKIRVIPLGFSIVDHLGYPFGIVREALRQINIQMIDSSDLYDGLENLWLGSADESLLNQQVRPSLDRTLLHNNLFFQSIVEQRWLTRLPPVLFICLNRYRFSATTKQASKILAPFEFYPEIYLDRYMLANKQLTLNKRNLARTLYAQLHDLEKTLNRCVHIRTTSIQCFVVLVI